MPVKRRYLIDLTHPPPNPGDTPGLRTVTPDDLEGLAELMLDGYLGTIDYEGEDLDGAVAAVAEFLADAPLLAQSFAVESDGRFESAVLLSTEDGIPFIRAVMTRRDRKRTGLARIVTSAALAGLAGAGHDRVVLYITVGNVPSEHLFASLGAEETT